jgi:hypothetical protein
MSDGKYFNLLKMIVRKSWALNQSYFNISMLEYKLIKSKMILHARASNINSLTIILHNRSAIFAETNELRQRSSFCSCSFLYFSFLYIRCQNIQHKINPTEKYFFEQESVELQRSFQFCFGLKTFECF